MNRLTVFSIRLYSRLLRLYPPQFRAEFADEMALVFTQHAHEISQRESGALITLVLAELRDLPLSVMREQLRERRKRILATNTGVTIMESGRSIQVFRFFSGSLFIVLAVFALIVVLPFFWLGLSGQTEMEVISGALGPEAFPLYGGSPNPLPQVAVLILLAAPVWDAVFGGGVLLMLGGFWRRLSPRQRRIGFWAVVAAITPTLFLCLPVGSSLWLWWMN